MTERPTTLDYVKKAIIGGASCAVAGGSLNPVDVVKIRMMNDSPHFPWPERSIWASIRRLYQEEGLAGYGRGMTATLMRESIYSTIRFGSYEPILDLLHSTSRASSQQSHGASNLAPPSVKFASALLSGALGAIIANPTDLIKVNLQSVLPPTAASSTGAAIPPPLPYTTALGGLRHIYATEGVRKGLYRGGLFTTARAAILTSAVIGSYDSIKNNILKEKFGMQDGNLLFVTCSMLAGVITTTAANPVDVLKTKYMSDTVGRYASPLQCAVGAVQEGGFKIFMKGWTPAYMRIAPYTVLAFVLMEQARLLLGMKTL
mmetsp:Transcript_3193/g.5662  ORF Transcript_3193/g.5662 Transcript_3193/m.5662 type:complete len:317 (+) Transcript_3193:54-1004(+)